MSFRWDSYRDHNRSSRDPNQYNDAGRRYSSHAPGRSDSKSHRNGPPRTDSSKYDPNGVRTGFGDGPKAPAGNTGVVPPGTPNSTMPTLPSWAQPGRNIENDLPYAQGSQSEHAQPSSISSLINSLLVQANDDANDFWKVWSMDKGAGLQQAMNNSMGAFGVNTIYNSLPGSANQPPAAPGTTPPKPGDVIEPDGKKNDRYGHYQGSKDSGYEVGWYKNAQGKKVYGKHSTSPGHYNSSGKWVVDENKDSGENRYRKYTENNQDNEKINVGIDDEGTVRYGSDRNSGGTTSKSGGTSRNGSSGGSKSGGSTNPTSGKDELPANPVYNPWSKGQGGDYNRHGPTPQGMMQPTMEALSLANAYFAPQRMELAYQLGDMETDMRRLAVNLGRQVDDPVLQAKLYKDASRSVRTLDVQQNTFAFQMAEQRRREETQNFQFYDNLAQNEHKLMLANQQFYDDLELRSLQLKMSNEQFYDSLDLQKYQTKLSNRQFYDNLDIQRRYYNLQNWQVANAANPYGGGSGSTAPEPAPTGGGAPTGGTGTTP